MMKKWIKSLSLLMLLVSLSIKAQTKQFPVPKSGPLPNFKLKKPQQFTLDNGLCVLVVEDHKLPRAVLSLAIHQPNPHKTSKKGVALLIANLLGTGTKQHAASEFNEILGRMGTRMQFSFDGVQAELLSEYVPETIQLLAESILYPEFKETTFNRVKQNVLDQLHAAQYDVTNIANRSEKALLFGKTHPYGTYANANNVAKLSLADVYQAYTNHYIPNNAYLVVMGAVQFEEIKQLVEANFSDWKPKSITKNPIKKLPNTPLNIHLIDVPNATQTEISVLKHLELAITSKDYFPMLVANHLLGGGSASRLYQNLRVANGYTYGAYATITIDPLGAYFDGYAAVRPDVTHFAISSFLNEMQHMANQPISEEELEAAKMAIISDFVINSQHPGTIATLSLTKIINQLPEDFYSVYLKNVQKVTIKQVRDVSQKYYGTEEAKIVVTGPAMQMYANLKSLKIPVQVYDKNLNPVTSD